MAQRPSVSVLRVLAPRATLMSAQIFLVVAGFTLTKALRDAVFLSHFQTHELAYVSLALAALAGLAAAGHARFVAARLSRGNASTVTLLAVAATLVGMAPWMRRSAHWIPWVLYLWSGVFGLFLVAQFWSMALEVFDAREVRRVLGLLAAGASLGGVAGGLVARWLGASVDDRSLLLIVAVFLVVAAGLSHAAWRLRPPPAALPGVVGPSMPGRADGAVAAIRGSPLLQSTAALLLCSIVAGTLLDFQIKAVVKDQFSSDRVLMTQFFGQLLAFSSASAVLLQAFTTPLLRRLGVANALLVLPATLLLAGIAMLVQPLLFVPLLWVVVGARTAETGVRNSIDKAAVELLYLPLPAATRASGKGLVDTVADRLGGAIAAFVWLALQQFAHVENPAHVRVVSVVVCVVCGVWAVIAVRGRQHHLSAFRDTLARIELHPEQILVPTGDDGQRDALARALTSADPSAARIALDVLADGRNAGVLVDVAPVLAHADPAMRARAIEVLIVRRDRNAAPALGGAFVDTDAAVRIAAVRWLAAVGPSVATSTQTSDRALGAAGGSRMAKRELIAAHLASPDPARRVLAALVAVDVDDRATLATLLADPDDAVAAAVLDVVALRRLANAVPVLLSAGSRPGMHVAVIRALARSIAPRALGVALLDPSTPAPHRALLGSALGATGHRDALAPLMEWYTVGSAAARSVALRALTQVRRESDRSPPRAWIESTASREITRLADLATLADWFDQHRPPHLAHEHARLLAHALQAAQDAILREVFLLLALGPAPKLLRDAWLALHDGGALGRATAIEFLDNALPGSLRALVLPIVEAETSRRRRHALHAHRQAPPPRSFDEVLERLAATDDTWLAALGTGLTAAPRVVAPRTAEGMIAAVNLR